MKQSLREDNVGDKDESTVSPSSYLLIMPSNFQSHHQTDEKSSGHDDIRRLSSSSQSVQHFGLASSRQRQRPRLSVRSVHNSIRSVHRHAKLIRRGSSMKSEGGEAYRDEVLARIFRYQRDKRIERQIALIQSALKDIRKDMQSLRESIAHGHLD